MTVTTIKKDIGIIESKHILFTKFEHLKNSKLVGPFAAELCFTSQRKIERNFGLT